MVQIIQKKLIQLSKALCITLPIDWLRKGFLTKGSTVDLVIMDNAILIADRSADFNADEIKADLDLAQKMWYEKEDKKDVKWFNKLSPEEQAAVRKMREQTTKDLAGKFDETNVIHLDSPDWNIKPREPCDPETMKLWKEKHNKKLKAEKGKI